MGDANILTLSEAAQYIRVSAKTMRQLARDGRVPGRKVGREWRFLRSALEAWLANPAARVPPQGGGQGAAVAEPDGQYGLPLGGFSDTAFSDNHKKRMHRWVPWIAGFSGSFVMDVIHDAAPNGGRLNILDPFAGVGTTLVEAVWNGHRATGFEINPYAALACKLKSRAASYDLAGLASATDRFDDFADEGAERDPDPRSVAPPRFRSRVPFFSPSVERQVLACMDFIREEEPEWVRALFRLALGSVMVGVSNYSYEPSLGTRAGAGRPNIDHADVFGIVRRKIRDIHQDIAAFQRAVSRYDRRPEATVHVHSYLDNGDRVPAGSVDLVITSPPYLNNYHYIRNTRPQLYWLGLVDDPKEVKKIERASFGQFWQTVRSGAEVPLEPQVDGLADRLEELRGRNADRGAYGGPGWANYAATYFNDCRRFCRVTKPLMRSGGRLFVVIGNSILQGVEFRTDRIFARIAEAEGFRLAGLHEVRRKRTGNSVVNSSVRIGTVSRPTRLYETVVELGC